MKRKKSSQTEKRPSDDTASDVTRSVRLAPPAHYSFKIESFSELVEMLSMNGDEKYESCDFEVGGFKWKLALYPNGYKKGKRKTKAVNSHVSLYLVLSETNNQTLGSGVSAFFRLSIYDQIRENYLTVQDATQKIVHFHSTNTESGFAQFVPLTTFHDASKGYLVDDCCIFGADVFVTNCTGKRENISVTNEPQEGFFYWKINDYSKLRKDHLVSNNFTVQGRDWYLSVYPRGESSSNNEFLALYLHLNSDSSLSPGEKMYCEYKLRLRDQLKGRHHERTGGIWFAYPTDSPGQRLGYRHFVPLSDLTDKSRGFLAKESVTSVRYACPAHYSFKIESFSGLLMLLAKTGKENYETCDFEVGGYNWKLSLYPNGDKKLNTTDHMSLYLVFSDTNVQQPLRAEATAFFRLFLYDQIKDKYYMVEDVSQKAVRFHAMKTESGFSHFIPFSLFHDTSNGYLVRDCCVFGAEVFVTNSTGKGERFIVLKDPQMTPFSWKIDDFSMLPPEEYHYSSVFTVGQHSWYLAINPGSSSSKGKHLSVYLHRQGVGPERKLWCEFIIRLKDQIKGKFYERTANKLWGESRSGWGFSNFLVLSHLKDESRGFLVNDTLIVEVQITSIRKTIEFS